MEELIELFFSCLFIYFLYKLIFDLILPVSKATASVRSKIKKMQQEQMGTQSNNYTNNTQHHHASSTAANDNEYIDFEEVK